MKKVMKPVDFKSRLREELKVVYKKYNTLTSDEYPDRYYDYRQEVAELLERYICGGAVSFYDIGEVLAELPELSEK